MYKVEDVSCERALWSVVYIYIYICGTVYSATVATP